MSRAKRAGQAARPRYRLQDLLRGMRPDHTPPQTDWGRPVGREWPPPEEDGPARAGQPERSR